MRMIINGEYYYMNGKKDHYMTWVNNSKFSWLVPVLCFILVAIVEGM